MSRRTCGMTLIEMVVVLTTASVVLGAGTTMLVTVMRAGQALREDQQRVRVFADLDLKMRDDCHRADRAELTDDALRLFVPGEHQVSYRDDHTGIVREERSVDGTLTRRETYRIDARFVPRWKVSNGTVSLSYDFESEDPRERSAWHSLQSQARLGNEKRLHSAFKQQETP